MIKAVRGFNAPSKCPWGRKGGGTESRQREFVPIARRQLATIQGRLGRNQVLDADGLSIMTDSDDRARRARSASPFLTSKQTAFYLGISPATLKALRARRAGPPARRHCRTLRYHIDDIDAWSKAQVAERDDV